MNKDTIEQAIRKGERVTLECKKAQPGVPNSVWETYSAFANTYGGLILSACSEKHWLKPELIEQPDLLQVKLILSIETKEGEAVMQKEAPVSTPVSTPVIRLLKVLENGEKGMSELQVLLDIASKKYIRTKMINPALNDDLINCTCPEKPHSPHQKYFLTEKGKQAFDNTDKG